MIAAVIYARVSSKDQEREGYSIPAQFKLLRDTPDTRFEIVHEFVDVETAKTAGRKQFGEMVQFLQKNPTCRIVIVEKTDRLYRNFRDYVTLEDLDIEIHLPKEGQIISKDSKSQAKLVHGIHVVMARNYIDNLREEVRKGMREKAEQGIYPSRPPIGYRNNKLEHTIEVDRRKGPAGAPNVRTVRLGQPFAFECTKGDQAEFGQASGEGLSGKAAEESLLCGLIHLGRQDLPGTHTPLVSASNLNKFRTYFADAISPNIGNMILRFADC